MAKKTNHGTQGGIKNADKASLVVEKWPGNDVWVEVRLAEPDKTYPRFNDIVVIQEKHSEEQEFAIYKIGTIASQTAQLFMKFMKRVPGYKKAIAEALNIGGIESTSFNVWYIAWNDTWHFVATKKHAGNMKPPGHALTDLVWRMKYYAIPNDSFPSKKIQDAYLDFQAIMFNDTIYKNLVVEGGEIGTFNKVKKHILAFHNTKGSENWLDKDQREAFNILINLILKNEK